MPGSYDFAATGVEGVRVAVQNKPAPSSIPARTRTGGVIQPLSIAYPYNSSTERITKPIPRRLSHHSGLRDANQADRLSPISSVRFSRRRETEGPFESEGRSTNRRGRSASSASRERWIAAIAPSIFASRASSSTSLDESIGLPKELTCRFDSVSRETHQRDESQRTNENATQCGKAGWRSGRAAVRLLALNPRSGAELAESAFHCVESGVVRLQAIQRRRRHLIQQALNIGEAIRRARVIRKPRCSAAAPLLLLGK